VIAKAVSGERAGRLTFFIFPCRNNTNLNVTPYRGSLVKLTFEFLWEA
jgi:hypothetical protein